MIGRSFAGRFLSRKRSASGCIAWHSRVEDASDPAIGLWRERQDDGGLRRSAAATRSVRGDLLVHLQHWQSNPLSRGSYTCYRPGQFTTIAGNEGKPVGNLFFAGEHANSFYEWHGFMEGACLSGIAAAGQVLA